jgi:hypothetical protein
LRKTNETHLKQPAAIAQGKKKIETESAAMAQDEKH